MNLLDLSGLIRSMPQRHIGVSEEAHPCFGFSFEWTDDDEDAGCLCFVMGRQEPLTAPHLNWENLWIEKWM